MTLVMANMIDPNSSLCPHCGQYHPIDGKFCPITGQPLATKVRICPNCGREVQATWLRCPYCATSLQLQSGRRSRTRRGWVQYILLIIILSVLVVGIMLVSRIVFPPNDEESTPTSNGLQTQTMPSLLAATPQLSSTYTVQPTTPAKVLPSLTPTPTKLRTRTSVPTRVPTITPTKGPWEACAGTYLTRLHVGDRAYVSFDPPLRNRMRSEPGTDAIILYYIETGEEMEILEGPVCMNGWVWWKVRPAGTNLVGWTAEGDSDNYWLVPIP